MPTIDNIKPLRVLQNQDIGKQNDTFILFEAIQDKADRIKKYYFDEITGKTQAPFTYQKYVVSSYTPSMEYVQLPVKPFLMENKKTYLLNHGDEYIFDVNINLSQDDIIFFAVSSDEENPKFTLEFSDTQTFTNSVRYTATADYSVEVGTDHYLTTLVLNRTQFLAQGSGSVDISKLIKAKIKNTSLSNASIAIAPIALYNLNSLSELLGSTISWYAHCLDSQNLAMEIETQQLTCGTSVIGEDVTSSTLTFSFAVFEEDAILTSLAFGSFFKIQDFTHYVDLEGYGVNNSTNTPVLLAGGIGSKIELTSKPLIKSVIAPDSSVLQIVPFNAGIAANPDIHLGKSQVSYDYTTGNLYFNSINVGLTPRIVVYKVSPKKVIDLIPKQTGYTTSIAIQEKTRSGSINYIQIKEATFKAPTYSREDNGKKQEFEMVVKFSNSNDIKIAYDL